MFVDIGTCARMQWAAQSSRRGLCELKIMAGKRCRVAREEKARKPQFAVHRGGVKGKTPAQINVSKLNVSMACCRADGRGSDDAASVPT